MFFKVTLPIIAPGIVAAAMLAFALSLDDFIITLFNAGNRVTYPLYVYGARRAAFPPQINVLATAILLLSLLALGATVLWQQRTLRAAGDKRHAARLTPPRPCSPSSRRASGSPGARRAAIAPSTGDGDADVAVVGAGLTGLWTALFLKELEPGLEVAVIEQGLAAYGASGRNAGHAVGDGRPRPRPGDRALRRGRGAPAGGAGRDATWPS